METTLHDEFRIALTSGIMSVDVMLKRQDAPQPLIILLMDAPGIRPELLDIANRLAAHGFCCAVPDLYYRFGRIRLDLTHRTEMHATLYRTLASLLVNDFVLDDFEHTVQYLLRRSQVLAGPVGLLGLSIGGRFAMNAVARFGHDIAAAAAVCPTGLELREAADPLYLALRKTSAALLFEFAEYDAAFQRATIPTFASFLQDNAAAVEAHVEAGTAHGYIFPSRPMYDHEASERSWERIIELFKRKLGR